LAVDARLMVRDDVVRVVFAIGLLLVGTPAATRRQSPMCGGRFVTAGERPLLSGLGAAGSIVRAHLPPVGRRWPSADRVRPPAPRPAWHPLPPQLGKGTRAPGEPAPRYGGGPPARRSPGRARRAVRSRGERPSRRGSDGRRRRVDDHGRGVTDRV